MLKRILFSFRNFISRFKQRLSLLLHFTKKLITLCLFLLSIKQINLDGHYCCCCFSSAFNKVSFIVLLAIPFIFMIVTVDMLNELTGRGHYMAESRMFLCHYYYICGCVGWCKSAKVISGEKNTASFLSLTFQDKHLKRKYFQFILFGFPSYFHSVICKILTSSFSI